MLGLVVAIVALSVAVLALLLAVGSHYTTDKKLKAVDNKFMDQFSNEDIHNEKQETGKDDDVIPKTIHFIYGLFEDNMPMSTKATENIKLWTKINPDYEIKLWDKEMCENLIENQFPEWSTLYFSFIRKVQRADLIRYLILLDQGGWYFDIDCKPVESSDINTLLQTHKSELVFFTEHIAAKETSILLARTEPIRKGTLEDAGVRLANFAFGSVPGHPVWEDILQELKNRCNQNDKHPNYSDYEVLFTTGPDCLTHVVNRSKNTFKIVSKRGTDSFLIHRASGTWRSLRDSVETEDQLDSWNDLKDL